MLHNILLTLTMLSRSSNFVVATSSNFSFRLNYVRILQQWPRKERCLRNSLLYSTKNNFLRLKIIMSSRRQLRPIMSKYSMDVKSATAQMLTVVRERFCIWVLLAGMILKAGRKQNSKITTAGTTMAIGTGERQRITRMMGSSSTAINSVKMLMDYTIVFSCILIGTGPCGCRQRMDARGNHGSELENSQFNHRYVFNLTSFSMEVIVRLKLIRRYKD